MQGPFTEYAGRVIITQVASALQYMHARGLMHRDVKLENVMLEAANGSYVAKLTGIDRRAPTTSGSVCRISGGIHCQSGDDCSGGGGGGF